MQQSVRDVAFSQTAKGAHRRAVAMAGNSVTLRVLLTAGAKIEAQSQSGARALHEATWCGHSECVRVLLDAGADSAAQDANGETPRDFALKKKRPAIAALLSPALLTPERCDVLL